MNAYLTLNRSKWKVNGLSLTDVIGDGKNKQPFYENVIQAYKNSFDKERQAEYEYCFDRYYRETNFSEKAQLSFRVRSVSPLAVGHGGGGVLETGLALHRIYGVPYLPATALKGLAVHYAHSIAGAEESLSALRQGGSDAEVLFGSQAAAGFIRFHDALIIPDKAGDALKLDVLTPHHQDYNGIVIAEGNERNEHPAPRDDDSSVPIPFLTAGGEFLIVLTCEGEEESAAQWLEIAKEILLQALEREGIGAKTNAGYGRMEESERNESA
ncbi:type III-B CRISPR module RAMP protein Cmr6 [Saccharibacillus sp. CPCC 101409]|uniref:type III-B CRISPR module RAMP protein Cmr6 n=1 Tax=Saccharibacillus sp. CPCC 101409 TaxID=3058041 RepID=UPI0026711C61|nr:type III-B CRISPR module RAMP protein Cmr6 [Saccharibacillus sp. CPCC 101409]MDO3411205.1 type III-B CRISPR module RAMP protein Cmr6 [Saccharibacillus sp. CPCC 101409]